ncbi:hypothetical protein [Sedimenticola selenatireducens]|uniref:Uncharacterized protein n=2 Tax=Sedimenticola TaxID=349742 RepID=A0A558CLR0_9GAMM|nr:hypothetical protein [Sedimenticola selenatireducens]TVO69674.1 hypothetical protein FHP88_17605 [Sedimenticola selenatireducens]TVT49696.1 MAG: hypothetical protein FHK82_16960 [Sedimenticola thiotaurini]TVT62258.1 MAG: hypothetical protein FHK78_15445 [Sedimenticola selenatireducens]
MSNADSDLCNKSVQEVIDLLMEIEDKSLPFEIVVWDLNGFNLDYSEARLVELFNTDGSPSRLEISISLTEEHEPHEEQPEPRVIDYCGQQMEIAPYEANHRPEAQACIIGGVPINPTLRPGFDSTPNEERDPLETSDWWDRPFIQAVSWADMASSYSAYLERTKNIPDYAPTPQVVFEAEQEERRENWHEHWPSGIRYDVRCLDGGAWDRSTNWGSYATLDEALAVARSGSDLQRSTHAE